MKRAKRFGAAALPLLCAAGLFLAVPSARAAQPGPGGPGHGPGMGPGVPVEAIDTNQDGRITQEEIDAFITREALDADTDKNGKITIAELREQEQRHREAMLEKRYNAMDANQDGVVSVDEYEQALKARFAGPMGGPGGAPGDTPPRQ